MISKDFISRLLKYKNVLNKLKSLGFARVFSDNLGDSIGVAPSQVRKDLAILKISGNKRGGYNVDKLKEELNGVLGGDKEKKAIIVGCGKIGTALRHYKVFSREGIKIVAGFDVDEGKIDEHQETPVYSIDKLKGFIKENKIRIGIITVTETAAASVLEDMIAAGIKGVLNFAPVQLRSTEQCIIHNINIELELENLFYFVNATELTKTVT